jgi:hypothetical protein
VRNKNPKYFIDLYILSVGESGCDGVKHIYLGYETGPVIGLTLCPLSSHHQHHDAKDTTECLPLGVVVQNMAQDEKVG